MGTNIRKTKFGWTAYYTDEEGEKHFVATGKTKEEILHRLLRIIKQYDDEFVKK